MLPEIVSKLSKLHEIINQCRSSFNTWICIDFFYFITIRVAIASFGCGKFKKFLHNFILSGPFFCLWNDIGFEFNATLLLFEIFVMNFFPNILPFLRKMPAQNINFYWIFLQVPNICEIPGRFNLTRNAKNVPLYFFFKCSNEWMNRS